MATPVSRSSTASFVPSGLIARLWALSPGTVSVLSTSKSDCTEGPQPHLLLVRLVSALTTTASTSSENARQV